MRFSPAVHKRVVARIRVPRQRCGTRNQRRVRRHRRPRRIERRRGVHNRQRPRTSRLRTQQRRARRNGRRFRRNPFERNRSTDDGACHRRQPVHRWVRNDTRLERRRNRPTDTSCHRQPELRGIGTPEALSNRSRRLHRNRGYEAKRVHARRRRRWRRTRDHRLSRRHLQRPQNRCRHRTGWNGGLDGAIDRGRLSDGHHDGVGRNVLQRTNWVRTGKAKLSAPRCLIPESGRPEP